MFTFTFLFLPASVTLQLKRHQRLLLISAFLLILVILFAKCMDFSRPAPATEKSFAGAASCRPCHASIADSYLQNPHHQTSGEVENDHIINGPGTRDAVYAFDQHTKVVVEKRSGGMYQVLYLDGRQQAARRFDLIIGSGEKAHTYGSWQGKELKQLPLSYFSGVRSWANSPGFPATKVYLDRPIGIRCLECHSSFAEINAVPDGGLKVRDEIKQSSLIYGIDCERCHGPAGRHVEFHLEHPEAKKAKFIVLYQALTRQQKTDACAVCHSGTDTEVQQSAFRFKPGDDLRNYHFTAPGTISRQEPDVHGNQARLLAESKCYIRSAQLECSSCHRIHESPRGNLTAYSRRCISCHATIRHSTATLANATVRTNCIDCHMPKQPSNLISFQLAGQAKTSQYLLRTHRIAIY